MNKKILIVAIIVLVLLIIPLTIFLVMQQQNVNSNAQVASNLPATNTLSPTPTTTPTTVACQPPDAVQNVKITYPYCQGQPCQFDQASCSWDQVATAVSYTATITQVDSGTVVATNSIQSPTVTTVFPVTQGKTYKCDVTATNACGASGGTGTDTLLCQVDQVFSPTPTVSPTPTTPTLAPTITLSPAPTATPTPILTTTTPIPPLPPTGNASIVKYGLGGVAITTFGGLLFLLSIL